MKTLAERNSVYELVIVVKRGICTEMIWVSDKNVANRLASVIYGKNMGFVDIKDKTFLIELTSVECKNLGLRKDCTSETFMFHTSKITSWLEMHLAPENLFDIESILESATFKPRTIVLAKIAGRECLVKFNKHINKDVMAEFINKGYELIDDFTFISNAALRLFSFMVPSTKSNIVEYEISNTTATRFKKLIADIRQA